MVQIDRVENLRTTLNKRQTLLRYRIHKVLTPQQDAKLKSITNPDNGRRGGPPR
jgi:Spy/CpxP family protein refolding chaperone